MNTLRAKGVGAWEEVGLLDSIELSVALRTAYYWMHHGAADNVAGVTTCSCVML